MILSPHFTDLRQGPGPSLSRAVSACPVVPRHYIAGTLMVNPTSITLAGTPWADPTSTKDRGEGRGEGTPSVHNIKGESEESPSMDSYSM